MRNISRAAAAFAAMALVTACSKPAENAVDNTTDTAAAVDAAPVGGTTPGGMVSPPAANEAIDTAATTETNVAAASNSFTEGQAKDHIEDAGYTGVNALTKTPEGLWIAKAMKDGKTFDVALDFKGAVTTR